MILTCSALHREVQLARVTTLLVALELYKRPNVYNLAAPSVTKEYCKSANINPMYHACDISNKLRGA